MNLLKLTASLVLLMWIAAPAAYADTGNETAIKKVADVDDKRLLSATDDGANWLSYGRTYDEQRFSPLTTINDKNVDKLGLQWSADLDTARGQEATPIVVDGVLYISTAWSMVKAFDAVTGRPLWSYDPQVPREKLVEVCCDAVNRGVAVYKGKVFVGTLAGHVVALDAATGKVVWDTQSIPVGSHMAITGAPRIVKGKVLIGAAGSEYFTRGYLAAFDADTGKEVWRFYTVPGDPSKPFEGKHLEAAAKTWSGDYWKYGGGGTVWDSITYDPVTDLVYFGTANAEPWNPGIRNSTAGDNLYTASIVAIRPDTGEYAWHFQETPEDRWDFDSNQQIIAANLEIAGQERRVVMHAPKNGFFYVLDASTGKFISGTAFATVNWASGLDPVSGRPQVNPEAKYEITGEPFTGFPGAYGAHTWHPMSYSPNTGLVYVPTNEAAATYTTPAKEWTPGEVGMQLGVDFSVGAMPADTTVRELWLKKTTGALVAWDPIAKSARWTVRHVGPANGGTLATAGNLVFQGTAGGEFRAYAADTGKQLWSFASQTGVVAGPATYSVDGKQYVAVLAGWGTLWDLYTGILSTKSGRVPNVSRLLVFALDGKDQLPPLTTLHSLAVLDPPPVTGEPERITDGALSFHYNCSGCHGDAAIAGVLTPDLRYSAVLNSPQLWQQIVHDGILKERGMVAWSANMTAAQIENIRLYIIKRANEDRALELEQAAVSQKPWNTPQGWSYVLNMGAPEIYQFGTSAQVGKTMEINTHRNVGILARGVSLSMDADVTISWDWQVDSLPSSVTEENAETHDYLSVAVLFDNGQDISYLWSSGLKEGTAFRCPLPDWADKETHLVIRSDASEIGDWLSEKRNLKADYARYIGGEMPSAITQVWLISNSIFQGGVGKARVANISIGSEKHREKIL